MFRTFSRAFLPNPFDRMLKRTARKGGKRILLAWNRGLGDIALGLYAMVQRIRTFIPDAEITFLTRENLREGFSMLEGVKTLIAPEWKRGQPAKIDAALKKQFDLVVEKPSPTDWVRWQLGVLVPRLKWDAVNDSLCEKFQMPKGFVFVGAQVAGETHYALWRDWPIERWRALFDRLEQMEQVRIVLFGVGKEPKFPHKNIIDLRGKTTLLELLSIIKHRCHALIGPDSGIASITYYLDASFPLRMISLWADPTQGILKQGVPSPNPQLVHRPLIAEGRDLSTVAVDQVLRELFPAKPLQQAIRWKGGAIQPERTASIVLAGGQGTRLGHAGPKGLFPIYGKPLFQWICEKVPRQLPLAIMTSPLNHEETVAFFKKNDFFGLEIHFFQQEMRPLLDEKRRPLKMEGPSGNGSVFQSFVKAGLGDVFTKRGIDLLTVVQVENPLADPLDGALIGAAREEKADMVVQCIERAESDRSMGVLVERAGKIEIVEYTELDPAQEYRFAYSGRLAFDLPFFCCMAEVDLPVHWVRKQVDGRWVWKGEQFIFDVLPFAKRARAVVVPRDTSYAPLKSREQVAVVEKQLKESG